MHYVIGVVGLLVFGLLAWLPSTDRSQVKRKLRPIAVMLLIEVALSLALLKTGVGTDVIRGIESGFDHLLGYAAEGTTFVFGDLTDVDKNPSTSPPFLLSVLMPIVFISALIGILQYTKILPLVVTVIGTALSKVNGMGKLESFNAVASALLGQSEVFISVKKLLPVLPAHRMYTLAASAMSTVSASILGAYLQLIDARFVITAIVLNLFGAFIVVSLINPYDPAPDSDVDALVAGGGRDTRPRQSFFEMLGEYILDGFKVAFTVGAMLIGFIALIAMLNGIFSGLFGGTTFQDVLGYAFSPLAWLTGIPWDESVAAGKFMATKLVANEVVAMLQLTSGDDDLSARTIAIVSTFLVSFANFSSIGIIAGAVRSLDEKQGINVARFGLRLLYGATLVSFISATIVGLVV
ncbi:MAG: NupC/NupG family nucleoside CNT transporter [Corynebacteriales bacterium]|uniref:NupC/NupG family nucleoside CNT transporter n=1 Tax=Williamsia herbipolensis TaxID=1603258 RepID=A0AAU4K5R6_9NOCA|nr:nucleoside transporter C-terminal domain-containing protein [Williamsia herbipolensis]MCX6471081.1 NupC/NupG family nucleoside CNT transporter [Mycobacteriales bacterium]